MESVNWQPDILGDGFEMAFINHPADYSGKVRSTVIRKLATAPSHKAILYVHGFSDYFLQKEMAQMFVDHGYNFYAIDLRKYGRSLLEGQRLFQVRDLHEYFPDIDSAVEIISADGTESIALLGHSTGGLTTSLYMSEKPSPLIKALMLNSPFLDWNMPTFQKKVIIPIASSFGRVFPNVKIHQEPDAGYANTLSAHHQVEWLYRDVCKPDVLPDPDLGWMRAIYQGQKQLRRQSVKVPVLLMHSSCSVKKGDSKESYFHADAILDVETISYYGTRLGNDVTEVTFQDGLHDLVLSKKIIREQVYETMLSWLCHSMPKS